jgi:hypothetical protein
MVPDQVVTSESVRGFSSSPYLASRSETSATQGQPPLARMALYVQDDVRFCGRMLEECYLCSSSLDGPDETELRDLLQELESWQAAGLEALQVIDQLIDGMEG